MPILGERIYQMSNAIFCYNLKPIPLAVYNYLVSAPGRKNFAGPASRPSRCTAAVRKMQRGMRSRYWWNAESSARRQPTS